MRGSPWKLYSFAFVLAAVSAAFWFMRWQQMGRLESTESASHARVKNNPKPEAEFFKVPRAVQSEGTAVNGSTPIASSMDSRALALRAFENKADSNGSRSAPSPMQAYERYARSSPHLINEQSFQALGARAVVDSSYNPRMGDVLLKKNGYTVVALDSSDKDSSWQDLRLKNGERPVVVNTASGQLAIVTGTVVLTLKNLSQAQAIATQEHFEIIGIDERISTVYMRAPEGYHLLSGVERLQADVDHVARVELELYQTRKVPR